MRAAREKGWRATGIVSLRDAKLRVRCSVGAVRPRRADAPAPAQQELPESVLALRDAVKALDATNNRLVALPPSLGSLSSLQRLVLAQNRLAELPPALCSLSALKTLSLDSNALAALPPALGSLRNLERLSLADNQLRELPPSVRARRGRSRRPKGVRPLRR